HRGSFTIAPAGGWSYTVNEADTAVNALAHATDTLLDLITITASDGEAPAAPSAVTMPIHGANDSPTIGTVGLHGDVTEDGATSFTGVTNGSATVGDRDSGDSPAFVGASGAAHGSFSIGPAGGWSYTVNEAETAVNALAHATATRPDLIHITARQGAQPR